jgi:hypothetical protein
VQVATGSGVSPCVVSNGKAEPPERWCGRMSYLKSYKLEGCIRRYRRFSASAILRRHCGQCRYDSNSGFSCPQRGHRPRAIMRSCQICCWL